MVKLKMFLDSADINAIVDFADSPKISGFTCNPSLLRKAGVTDYLEFACAALAATAKPISFEVIADEFPEMERQAKILSSLADNVFVKIPITNSRGDCSVPLIEQLSRAEVKVNVTAVFTGMQIKKVAKVLTGPPAIISIFAGRIADTGIDPKPFFTLAKQVSRQNVETLWASTRELYNLRQCRQCSADIITVPLDLLAKLHLVGKDLNEYSRETVRMFFDDATASGLTL